METTSEAPDQQSATTINSSTTCMIYDEEDLKNLLRDLTVINNGQINPEIPTTSLLTVDEVLRDLKISSTLSCSSCQTQFASHSEQRAHFKTEWHRHNLKQKLKGIDSITQEEFETRSYDADTGGGTKSPPRRKVRRPKPSGLPSHMSGRVSPAPSNGSSSTDSEDEFWSDADDDSDIRRNPKHLFKNGAGKILCVYRCVLHGKQTVPKDIVVHKTFHRYTVRAKQGSSQGSRDGRQSGSAPRSGGASLRRQNEAGLVQDVQILLELWDSQLKKCHAVFFRAPGSNKAILFGDSLDAAVAASQKVLPFHNQFSPAHKPKRKKEKEKSEAASASKSKQEEPSDTFPGVTDSDEAIRFLSAEETFDTSDLKIFDSSEKRHKSRKKGRKNRDKS
uniref:VLRF1 domain-containing protein n=1 Tax=Strigamia maritima TaxID=126957 RepID=T1J913_STRMM